MITIFYIIETILIYFYSLGFSLNARPHKQQRFNHHRVEIKVVVVVSVDFLAFVTYSVLLILCTYIYAIQIRHVSMNQFLPLVMFG